MPDRGDYATARDARIICEMEATRLPGLMLHFAMDLRGVPDYPRVGPFPDCCIRRTGIAICNEVVIQSPYVQVCDEHPE